MTGKECRAYAAHAVKEMHKPFLPQLSLCVKLIRRCNGFGVLERGGFSQRCLGPSRKWWHSSPPECFSVLLLRGNPWPQFRRFFFFLSFFSFIHSASHSLHQVNEHPGRMDETVLFHLELGGLHWASHPLTGRLGGMSLNLLVWGHFFHHCFQRHSDPYKALIRQEED